MSLFGVFNIIEQMTVYIRKGGPNSMRSVVPQEILKLLELEQGDSLHWKVIIEDKITVEVNKARSS
ncbi:hypothetical protein [Methanobrevibacter sp.]|uniref:hypothetical protein n=1 Tax=Methanobrevibacter sp. TaxID=66852 RepID=UPI003D7D33F0